MSTVGLLQYIEPSLAFLLALFWFGEIPDPWVKSVGFAFVWAGLLVSLLPCTGLGASGPGGAPRDPRHHHSLPLVCLSGAHRHRGTLCVGISTGSRAATASAPERQGARALRGKGPLSLVWQRSPRQTRALRLGTASTAEQGVQGAPGTRAGAVARLGPPPPGLPPALPTLCRPHKGHCKR